MFGSADPPQRLLAHVLAAPRAPPAPAAIGGGKGPAGGKAPVSRLATERADGGTRVEMASGSGSSCNGGGRDPWRFDVSAMTYRRH